MYVYSCIYTYINVCIYTVHTVFITDSLFTYPTTPPVGGMDPAAAASPASHASRAGATPALEPLGWGCSPV